MTKANEPANPTLTYNVTTGKPDGHYLGLTKRELFAAKAMQGLISREYGMRQVERESPTVAELAVKMADALIAALNQPTHQ